MKEEIGSEFWIDDVANESNDIYHDFKENGFGGVIDWCYREELL